MENERRKNNKIGLYLLIFFIGCLAMYGIMYFFPTTITESITKLEKDVTVTETGIADAVEKVYDAVVVVSTYRKDTYIASGTGFIFKNDDDTYYILTNNHVIENGDKVTVTFTDESVKEVEIVGADKYSDIAVLSLNGTEKLTVAQLGSSTDSRVGDTTFAVGAPLDSEYSWTVTRGIISGKDRMVQVSLSSSSYYSTNDYVMKVLQTDAAINSGNSGGPLCNSNGEVIGITSLKLVSSGVEGMGFAIPIEIAIEKAQELINGETTELPYVGVSIGQSTSQTKGVIVTSVEKGSAADDGGIEVGDIITEIEGNSVSNLAYFRYYLYQHNVGDKIKIKLYRDGEEKIVTITLKSDKITS